jgi:hypothetical protein
VEGTAVYGANGQRFGTIKRLVIEKLSGRVVYVVMSFGGFLGFGNRMHTIPWAKLDYEPTLGGFRLALSEEQLKTAPNSSAEVHDWTDREHEKAIHSHYEVPPYWLGF